MLYILTFFYVFGFKIYSIIDSTILVGIFLTVRLLINKNLFCILKKKIYSKNTFKIIIIYLAIILCSLVAVLIGKEYDFSYIETIIHLGVVICIGYELASYFEYKKKSENILNYIIIVFIVQTIFQWICYIFPTISSMFNYFRSQAMIIKSVHYGGFRGIALAQSGFFSLSSAYAVIILLYFSKNNTIFKNTYLKYFFFFVLLTGTFFAGRTGYIGLIFTPILLWKFNMKNFLNKDINIRKICITILCICIFLCFVKYMSNNEKLYKLYKYTFELFNNFTEGKGFKSTSTDALLNMYDIDIDAKTIILGDGKYTNDNGRYYMNTDVGFLRKILYFGSIGLILSIIFQVFLMNGATKKKEGMVLLLLLLVLELKGEIIGINIMVNSFIILYTLCLEKTDNSENDLQKNNMSKNNIE